MYPIPFGCVKYYQGEHSHLKENEIGYGDHVFAEKRRYYLLWDEVQILGKKEHYSFRCLKELVHMIGYENLLSRSSIDLSTIWQTI